MAFKEIKTKNKNHAEYNKFSGASWQELEDIFPKEIRVSSEAYIILSVFYPAWRALHLKYKFKQNEGTVLQIDDFFLLCWVLRCEDAKGNVATEGYPISKPLQWNQRMRSFKQSRLHRLKLVENMPYKNLRLYRVTAKGRLLIRDFFDMVEQAHKDIKYFSSIQPPENAAKVDRIMRRFFELGGMFNYEDIKFRL